MRGGPRLNVNLTRQEVIALTIALSEYVYLLEEGNLDEAIDEAEEASESPILTAPDAAELKARLEAML